MDGIVGPTVSRSKVPRTRVRSHPCNDGVRTAGNRLEEVSAVLRGQEVECFADAFAIGDGHRMRFLTAESAESAEY